MKRARFKEEQIISILKEAEAGAKVTELCRRHGISDATFYLWRNKYGGFGMPPENTRGFKVGSFTERRRTDESEPLQRGANYRGVA